MNISKVAVRTLLIAGFACALAAIPLRSAVAGSGPAMVPVLQRGFDAWGKMGDAGVAMNAWSKGGLVEQGPKVAMESGYFRRIGVRLGKFKSYEVVNTKPIGQSSEILYLSINFEHGAVYGRFLLYRSEKDWVVQDMDFSTRPEAIMPWLAFEGGSYAE